jgi:hypothetical protein
VTEAKNRSPIIVNSRTLHGVESDLIEFLKETNKPPVLFQCDFGLGVLKTHPVSRRLALVPANEHLLRNVLDRFADWARSHTDSGGRTKSSTVYPPIDFVRDLLFSRVWDPVAIPILRRVTGCPLYTASGDLILKPGYHADLGVLYNPATDLALPSIPPAPTPDEVAAAVHLLVDELLVDFPFKCDGNASRAHSLAAILTPFVRDAISGPVPMLVIDAAQPGTGKGLLAEIIALLATGQPSTVTPFQKRDDELRKALTAALLAIPEIIHIDNAAGHLDFPSLAAFLTAGVWKDRFLGESRMVEVLIRCLVLITGNNVELSEELARRSLWVRMEANTEHPWERDPSKFRHHPLEQWVKDNRNQLVGAVLILIQNWHARGKPKGKGTLGRFESFCEIVGGILDAANVAGFLANSKDLFANASDPLEAEWKSFLEVWASSREKTVEVGVAELFPFAQKNKLLPSLVNDTDDERTNQSDRRRLGKALPGRVGKRQGRYALSNAGAKTRGGQRLYSLLTAAESSEAADAVARTTQPAAQSIATESPCFSVPVGLETVAVWLKGWWYLLGGMPTEKKYATEMAREIPGVTIICDVADSKSATGINSAGSAFTFEQLVGKSIGPFQMNIEPDGDRFCLQVAEGNRRREIHCSPGPLPLLLRPFKEDDVWFHLRREISIDPGMSTCGRPLAMVCDQSHCLTAVEKQEAIDFVHQWWRLQPGDVYLSAEEIASIALCCGSLGSFGFDRRRLSREVTARMAGFLKMLSRGAFEGFRVKAILEGEVMTASQLLAAEPDGFDLVAEKGHWLPTTPYFPKVGHDEAYELKAHSMEDVLEVMARRGSWDYLIREL